VGSWRRPRRLPAAIGHPGAKRRQDQLSAWLDRHLHFLAVAQDGQRKLIAAAELRQARLELFDAAHRLPVERRDHIAAQSDALPVDRVGLAARAQARGIGQAARSTCSTNTPL